MIVIIKHCKLTLSQTLNQVQSPYSRLVLATANTPQKNWTQRPI